MLNLLLMAMPNLEDENKFSEIYNTYCKYVFGVVSKFFSNNMDKEDAAYTSLFKIALNISKINDINSAETKSFIAITTKNTCITMINKSNKIKEFPIDDLDKFQDRVNPVEEIENEESFLDYYCNCLRKLTKNQYEILYLRYVNELNLKEIATVLDIKENAVKQRLYNSKHKLHNLIIEDMNNER